MNSYIVKLMRNKPDLSVYLAHAMTGRMPEELLAESQYVQKIGSNLGVIILDPVIEEKVKLSDKPLHNQTATLKKYWARDKELIRMAHVLIDVTGPKKSEGVAHEIGYARFFLWKPVVRVYKDLGPSIARFEDDVIADSIVQAFLLAVEKWGTPRKRLRWRLRMLLRCFARFVKYQMGEFK